MQFHFIPKAIGGDHWTTGFTLDRVWADEVGKGREISHMLDQSYMYHSARELQWHLAERFGLPAQSVRVTSTT
ncbi:hypothetical protein [Microvirga roseola]|uniref:hypothetical protein n=1 Tax=Microvirga roseola TaxID=2883126 RepID=UPI001E4BC32B|nr:hypothetical protein [Microvirga roseola]